MIEDAKLDYKIEQNKIVFPKRGINGLRLLGVIPFLIGGAMVIKLLGNSNDAEPVHIGLSVFITLIGAFFITFKTAASISKNNITKTWYGFFMKLRRKTIPISRFDTIFVKKQSFITGTHETPGGSSVAYHVTLADSTKYTLDTDVITPDIYKYIYHINQHVSFEASNDHVLQDCRSFVDKLHHITGLEVVFGH